VEIAIHRIKENRRSHDTKWNLLLPSRDKRENESPISVMDREQEQEKDWNYTEQSISNEIADHKHN
jgi:hypothetical protein